MQRFDTVEGAVCGSSKESLSPSCVGPSNPLISAVAPYLPDSILTLLLDTHTLAFTMALLASMGTFLGGVVVVLFARITGADPSAPATARIMGILQAFSAGVMMYITCFDLVPEAIENIGSRECMLWFFGGVVAFGVLEEWIIPDDHDHEEKDKGGQAVQTTQAAQDVRDSRTDTRKTEQQRGPLTSKERRELFRTSLITFLALALHNLPEGLSVYLSTLSDLRLGSQLAIAIMLHNIPEGMAVAIPLYAATGNSWNVLLWTMLNGLAEPAGVIIGGFLLHSYLSSTLLSRCLAGVGGIMACISIHELQPAAVKYAGKTTATTAFFIGMFICFTALESVNEWFGGHDHSGKGHAH